MTAKSFKGRKGFDANNHPIQNVKSAELEHEAVNLGQLNQVVVGLEQNGCDLAIKQLIDSSMISCPIVICRNTEPVEHSLNKNIDRFTINNHLAIAPVSLKSDIGIINPFLPKSANIGLEWESLEIKSGAYVAESASGHIVHDNVSKTLYVLGDNLNPIVENVSDFSVSDSGKCLYYITNGELYRVEYMNFDDPVLLKSDVSRVDCYGSNVSVINSSGTISYSIDAGNTFIRMEMLIPANKFVSAYMLPAIFKDKQVQYLGNVYKLDGRIVECVATEKGVLVVSDNSTKCSIHLITGIGITKIKDFDGYYQAFTSNRYATKLILLLRDKIIMSNDLYNWIDYKTDIVVNSLSLNNDSTSLLAIGNGKHYLSTYTDNGNSLSKLNGFTMPKNSTVELVKFKELSSYVVINQTNSSIEVVEEKENTGDIWITSEGTYVAFNDTNKSVYLNPEPKDGFKCEISVPLMSLNEDIVTVYAMGNEILNADTEILIDSKIIDGKTFVTYDGEEWVILEGEYNPYSANSSYDMVTGETIRLIYSKSRNGWVIY